MLRWITGPLPHWAEENFPMLRYQLRQLQPSTRSARLVRALLVILVLLVLAGAGYAWATRFFQQPAGQHLTEQAIRIVHFPIIILQVVMSLYAYAFTSGMVSQEQQRQTWDSLRSTSRGTILSYRVRLAALFYRLRPLLIVVIATRVLLVIGVLYDLTAFRGRYLEMLSNNITPELPVVATSLLLALLLAASLLLPFTSLALQGSLGLLLSTVFRQRIYSLIIQFMVMLLHVAMVVGLTWLALDSLQPAQNIALPATWVRWLALFGFGALGDWSLYYLQLSYSAEAWAVVPYGILMMPALFIFCLVQALTADGLLRLATRLGERTG